MKTPEQIKASEILQREYNAFLEQYDRIDATASIRSVLLTIDMSVYLGLVASISFILPEPIKWPVTATLGAMWTALVIALQFSKTKGPFDLWTIGPISRLLRDAALNKMEESAADHMMRSGLVLPSSFLVSTSIEILQAVGPPDSKLVSFNLLACDYELTKMGQELFKARTTTTEAIKRLGFIKDRSESIGRLIEGLSLQVEQLRAKEGELQLRRNDLNSDLASIASEMNALEQARLAFSSLKLYESNKDLIDAADSVMASAKAICERWEGSVKSLGSETSVLLKSLPEASQVYEVQSR